MRRRPHSWRSRASALACAAALGGVIAAGTASAAPAAPGVAAQDKRVGRERVRTTKLDATRVDDDELAIDGRLDEPAWRAVPRLPELIQVEPRFGADPTRTTEIRVAYGREGLYVAFQCNDDPKRVHGAFVRRDEYVPVDAVTFEIDPSNDDTNGYRFVVNPAGSQSDAQLFRDDSAEWLWDGVWQAAARKNEAGWAAELFIPWSTLRFDRRDRYTFGINAERWINDVSERSRMSPAPQGLPGVMSYALDYRGVEGIEPGLDVEVRPYLSTRIAARRPDGSLDLSTRLLANGGVDVKYGIRGNLTLDLSVNPDFGQAEVDPAVLNLSPFEIFFPERRSLFLESKEIFETRFSLFYSRRIGAAPQPSRVRSSTRRVGGSDETGELVALDPLTPILGAVRLTGQLAPGWRIGVLSATTGPTQGVERFSDGLVRRVAVDPLTQYSVVRLRRELDSQTSIGMIATSVNRAAGVADAFSGGLDYRALFGERWRHSAQLVGTYDGKDAGLGGFADVRRSSRNTDASASVELLTPKASLNDLGYMRFADYITGRAKLSLFNAQPLGKVRRLEGGATGELSSSFAGLLQVKQLETSLELTTQRFWRSSLGVGGHWPQLDLYETRGGMPYEVPGQWWISASVATPINRRISGSLWGAYGQQGRSPDANLGIRAWMRPLDRLSTSTSFELDMVLDRPRWTTRSATDEPIFGRGDLLSYTWVLEATLGILPTLTLQSYNQLLYSTAHHTDFFVLTAPQTLVATEAAPYLGVVDRALTSLVSNSILRWEYLPGAYLSLVHTHRTRLDDGGMEARFEPRLGFSNLVAARAADEDIVFLKLVHLFAL